MKRSIVLLAAALAVMLALAPMASGGTRYPSRITIAKAFHGRVFLRHAAQHPRVRRPCRTRRRVTLFWTNHGGHTKAVGSTRTNRRGRWAIPAKAHHGSYFARAKRRVLPRRHHAVCAPATSRRIAVGH